MQKDKPIVMLWFDNNPKRSFADRLADGVAYYAKKYGVAPTICEISPVMFKANKDSMEESGDFCTCSGVRVVGVKGIRLNDFHISARGVGS